MRLGRAELFATALIVFAVSRGMTAQGPASAGPYTADLLRDLPSGANLFSILEAAQPEVISDRFNSGGLNAGQSARAGAFLASWSQTQYRIGDISVSSPVDGAPLLFPEIAWWNQMQVTTGLMPAGAAAPGLAVSLEPRHAATRWTRTLEGSASGGGLAQAGSATRPPPIVRLGDWAHVNVLLSGPAMNGRLGVVAGGSWTGASRFERGAATRLREETGSAFAHAVYRVSPAREWRGLAWVQDRSVHLQTTIEHRARDAAGWRIFGGYTARSPATAPETIDAIDADRLVDGPIPALIPGGDGAERRWSLGARVSPARPQVATRSTLAVTRSGLRLRRRRPSRVWSTSASTASPRACGTTPARGSSRIATRPW